MKRLVICAAIVLAAAHAIARPDDVKELRLPNGLQVLVKESHTTPVAVVMTYFHVGSRNEVNGLTGTSHFNEHMAFKGAGFMKKGDLDKLVASAGGENNAFTWYDCTAYHIKLPAKDVELALKIWAATMADTKFVPEEFAAERQVIISELQGGENDPGQILFRNMTSAMFNVHPYQWPVVGWFEDLENVDRDAAYKYWRDYYCPNNATLIVVGDVKAAQVFEWAKKYYGKIAKRDLPKSKISQEPPQRGEKRLEVRMAAPAATCSIGWRTPRATDPDAPTLELISALLGSGRTSRFYQSIVETQKAQDASAWFGRLLDPFGFFVDATALNGGADPKPLEEALLAEVEKLKNTPVSEAELARIKKQYRAARVFSRQSVMGLAEELGEGIILANDWSFTQKFEEAVQRVTPEDIQRVAAKYFTPENRTVGWLIPTQPGGEGFGAGQIGAQRRPSWPKRALRSVPLAERLPKEPQPILKESGPVRKVLPNGMTVIVQHSPDNPSVSFSGSILAGSAFDPRGREGLAALTADMLDRGTSSRSSKRIAEEVENVGASFTFAASRDTLGITGIALKEDFPAVLQVLADCLLNPTFPPDEFEKAKLQMLSSIDQREQDTAALCERLGWEELFPADHPYHFPSDGYKESVSLLSREDTVSFWHRYGRPDTTILVLVGDISPDEGYALCERLFGAWTGEGPRPVLFAPEVSLAEALTRTAEIADKTQADIGIFTQGVSRRDPNFLKVRLLNYILGGDFSSRIMSKVRDELGLAYYAYSMFNASWGAGPHVVRMGVNPKNLQKALDAAKTEMAKFHQNGITAEELKRAQGAYAGSILVRLDTNAALAAALLEYETYGWGLDYNKRFDDIVRKLTLSELNELARKFFDPDKAVTVIVKPKENK